MSQELNKSAKPETVRQAVIQTGSLGFYPWSEQALQAISQAKAHVMIQMVAPQNSTINLYKPATGTMTTGRSFESLSDAFYRGGLPEVLVVTSPMAHIPTMLEDWLSYIEKLGMLGYFSPSPEVDEVDALDQCVPTVVLASSGIIYNAFMTQLEKMLHNMDALTPRQKERMVQKFVRGFWETSTAKTPWSLQLAGKKSWYSMRACNLLESMAIAQNFNPNETLGVLEGELKQAYLTCTQEVIPALITDKQLSAKNWDAKGFMHAVDALAQAAGILPGLVGASPKGLGVPPRTLTLEDLALLHQLNHLARVHQQTALLAYLDTLKTLVQQQVSVPQP